MKSAISALLSQTQEKHEHHPSKYINHNLIRKNMQFESFGVTTIILTLSACGQGSCGAADDTRSGSFIACLCCGGRVTRDQADKAIVAARGVKSSPKVSSTSCCRGRVYLQATFSKALQQFITAHNFCNGGQPHRMCSRDVAHM